MRPHLQVDIPRAVVQWANLSANNRPPAVKKGGREEKGGVKGDKIKGKVPKGEGNPIDDIKENDDWIVLRPNFYYRKNDTGLLLFMFPLSFHLLPLIYIIDPCSVVSL